MLRAAPVTAVPCQPLCTVHIGANNDVLISVILAQLKLESSALLLGMLKGKGNPRLI